MSTPQELAQEALRRSTRPPRAGEWIDWAAPLFDSDGAEHYLVELGGLEVVTKTSYVYVVWSRRDGKCWRSGAEDVTLSNTPMSPEERARRVAEAREIVAGWERERAGG